MRTQNTPDRPSAPDFPRPRGVIWAEPTLEESLAMHYPTDRRGLTYRTFRDTEIPTLRLMVRQFRDRFDRYRIEHYWRAYRGAALVLAYREGR